MKVLNIGGIATSLGETIYTKHNLDLIKHNYDRIDIGFYIPLLDQLNNTENWSNNKQLWHKYLNDIGNLFFGEKPYNFNLNSAFYGGNAEMILKKIRISPSKPELSHLLCKGEPLNIGDYIVITTKVRNNNKYIFYPKSIEMWKILRKISEKYKIVILGERKVEMRQEYNNDKNEIYGIYDDIICNLPKDKLIDLTIPSLGETVSDFSKIQQDCLIMHQAKFVLLIGIGGNFCMSTAVANMSIGYRNDNSEVGDIIYTKEYSNAIITKNWDRFIQAISSYI